MRWTLPFLSLLGCGGSGVSAPASDTSSSFFPPSSTGSETSTTTPGTPTGTGTTGGTTTGTGTTSTTPSTGTSTGTTTSTGTSGTTTGGTSTGTSGTTTGGTSTGTSGTTGGTGGTVSSPTTGGTPSPWSETIAVDGDLSDWDPAALFAVDGGEVGITWDSDRLYVAALHSTVYSGGPQHWLLVYLGDGGLSGSSVGTQFNTQLPDLAVAATRLFRWKADDSWNSWMVWDGVQWVDSPYWVGTSTSELAEQGNVVEVAIPFTSIGVGDLFSVHVSWVYEGSGYESSYACSPQSSFVSGTYDPNYDRAWVFDRQGADAPTTYTPQP